MTTALRSQGRRGRVAWLRFIVVEAGGQTSERITVRTGRRPRVVNVSLGPVVSGRTYRVRYRLPRWARTGNFCVQSTDAAGNVGAVSCARLVVRR